MLSEILAEFYERDILKLKEEVDLFRNEENLWKTSGSVKNSSGNIVLHIIGGLNYLIGATLGQTEYIRNRDQEFIRKDVPRAELLSGLDELVPMVREILGKLTAQQMEDDFPIFFDRPKTSTSYVLVQLALHLNYHLGQVNYLRRILE